ncbi:hypothetical protein CYMTET_47684 [Cymbomonas tetramitiformis]|uniref:Class I SAM-dependent methyltransferase n=1 Tax=Cymbomonas tetramitiformis TaxID=36881 RepID=A0AAE0EVQ9_9CHLO|nr:hypothetical protein CYMTET_47684 [Cymbomonas tetramitiformis]
MSAIYYEHNPYEDFQPDRQYSGGQGWDGGGYDWDVFHLLTAQGRPPQLVVEVGVWRGKTALVLAKLLQGAKGGVLIAVDTWLGALEFWTREKTQGRPDPQRDLVIQNGFPSVFYSFLSNVMLDRLQSFVIPFPVPSRLAADFLLKSAVKADIVHLDGAHEYHDVIDDIRSWIRNLSPGAILIGDDYTSSWPGLQQAVNEFEEETGLQLHFSGPGGRKCQPCRMPMLYTNAGAGQPSENPGWIGDEHTGFPSDMWAPPPLRQHFSQFALLAEMQDVQPSVVILNKYTSEWDALPKNHLTLEMLSSIFSTLEIRGVRIIYFRACDTDFESTEKHQDHLHFGDLDMIRERFPKVQILQDHQTANPHISLNEMLKYPSLLLDLLLLGVRHLDPSGRPLTRNGTPTRV